LNVLIREVVRPRWAHFRLWPPSLDGLTRRRNGGLVRLLHVDGAPVAVAVRGTVFAARAHDEATARAGIARMRFAVGIDDDLEEFHERFGGDRLIGRAVRMRPGLRVRRQPQPWEALAWAITEQLITLERATEIQKQLIYRFGPRLAGLRDSPSAATVAARSPAEIEACGLAPKRAIAMRRAAREVAAGRVTFDGDMRRLLAIPEIGTWTVEMLALHGLGRLDVIPAGDLGYLKIVGQITTGNPRAIADEAEVRGFFARYAPFAGHAAQYVMLSRGKTGLSPLQVRTRSSAAAPPKVAA
jgi:3-methyladenine DNA glycosylase/8-oxoguanine DNA glycosylase